ncbi:hypothetical protein ACFV2X_17125 [Streptomyces sp. NPDC059679]
MSAGDMEVAGRAQGGTVVLRAAGRGPRGAARFEAMFAAARRGPR